jgi:hypothetical protein
MSDILLIDALKVVGAIVLIIGTYAICNILFEKGWYIVSKENPTVHCPGCLPTMIVAFIMLALLTHCGQ